MYHNDTCINVDGGRWLVRDLCFPFLTALTLAQVMKGIYDGLRLREDSYIA